MKKILLSSLIILGFLVSCSLDEISPKTQATDTKNLVTGNFVAIGNSLTAGFQSGSLVEGHQQYSFPALIAKQMGVSSFAQPTVSYPGLPNIMEIVGIAPTGTPIVGAATGTGAPTNATHAAPYNNMGIPGIVLHDVLNATSTAASASKAGLIDLVLRGQGTVYQQVKALQPSFISLWIGNNDVLGYATSGAYPPGRTPTGSGQFEAMFTALADSIALTGAKVVVGNIPEVTSIPFFTYLGPAIKKGLPAGIPGIYYQEGIVDTATSLTPLDNSDVLITLAGITYVGEIGKPSGKFYRSLATTLNISVDILLASSFPNVDTTQAFALSPKNPWPQPYVLDAAEIAVAKAAVSAYNTTIKSVANSKDWAVADINMFLKGVSDNHGFHHEQGLELKTSYISGEIFSLDGVHPSTLGYAVVANKFIEAIDAKFGTTIPAVSLKDLRGKASLKKNGINNFMLTEDALENTLKVLGAK